MSLFLCRAFSFQAQSSTAKSLISWENKHTSSASQRMMLAHTIMEMNIMTMRTFSFFPPTCSISLDCFHISGKTRAFTSQKFQRNKLWSDVVVQDSTLKLHIELLSRRLIFSSLWCANCILNEDRRNIFSNPPRRFIHHHSANLRN